MSTGLATNNTTPTTLEGDVTGATSSTEVVGIQNTPISNTPVEGGDGSFLGVATSGTSLEWLSVPAGFTAGQDLSGTSTSQTVIGIQDTPISNTPSDVGDGSYLSVTGGGTSVSWLTIPAPSLATIDANINVRLGDYNTIQGTDYYIFVDTATAGSPITIYLQADYVIGTTYYVKDYTGAAATYNITVYDNGGNLIDGSSTYVLNLNYACVGLVFSYDYNSGLNAWSVISAYNGTIV